jgi:AcrR family transcriptional regulator
MGATGWRERKKQQTRQRMINVALELFDERGFDRVPVAEVARAAEVSEATIFNYFPTKEDLVYGSMVAFEATLLDAVRRRPAGTSVLAAFRDCVLQPRGALATDDPAITGQIARTARIIAGSGGAVVGQPGLPGSGVEVGGGQAREEHRNRIRL